MMKKLVGLRGKHRASWVRQFMHLSARAARNTLRNPFPFLLHGHVRKNENCTILTI